MPARLNSQEEVTERAAYRQLLEPKEIRDRLEAYSKWLFGGTTALTALGALFTYTGAGGLLLPGGMVVFAVALAFMGVSMGASAFALAPIWERRNPNSLDSMKKAFDREL